MAQRLRTSAALVLMRLIILLQSVRLGVGRNLSPLWSAFKGYTIAGSVCYRCVIIETLKQCVYVKYWSVKTSSANLLPMYLYADFLN